MGFVARCAGLSCSVYNLERMTICAKLSLGVISAINRTVFKLPFPNYSFADRSWTVLLLWFLGATCYNVCVYVRCNSIFKCFYFNSSVRPIHSWGWSGGAMVLGKLPVPGRPTIWITVGQGPTALAVGAGGGCLDIFTLIYPFSALSLLFLCSFSPLSPSLWETARYRQTEILSQRAVKPKTTNQPTHSFQQW